MDKNSREKEQLHKWAVCNTDKIDFYGEGFEQNSFFIERRDNAAYINEYGFESVPELRQILESLWEKDEYMRNIIKTVLVATMKNVPRKNQDDGQTSDLMSDGAESQRTEDEMPIYIYNF